MRESGSIPALFSSGSRPAAAGRPSLLAQPPLLILALLVYALFLLGGRGLWKPDEGRYTCVAVNMLAEQNFLFPELHDERPHYTKPPLTYWAIAAGVAVFGRHEWAARLPMGLAFFGTVLLVAAMGKRLVPRSPRLPALIYATSIFPYVAATLVTTDTLLTFFEALAMYAFIEWWSRGEEPSRRNWMLLMWSAFGLAFMTKGPPGLLPLAALLIFVGLQRGWGQALRLCHPLGLTLFAVLGLWWYVVVVVARPGLLGYFFGDEVVGRLAGEHGRNAGWSGIFKAYLPIIVGGALPWNIVLVRDAIHWWKTRKQRATQSAAAATAIDPIARGPWWKRWLPVRPENKLLALWLIVPMIVFSLAQSRLPLYILPLFVPLSLALGRRLEGLTAWSARQPRRAAWLLGAWVAFMAVTRIGAAMVHNDKDSRLLANAIRSQVEMPISEVIFVDDVPDYGLRFYLDAEVERVDYRRTEHEESLTQELAEREAHQVYLVDDEEVVRFRRITPPGRQMWVERGKYEDICIFTLEPRPEHPTTPQPAQPAPTRP